MEADMAFLYIIITLIVCWISVNWLHRKCTKGRLALTIALLCLLVALIAMQAPLEYVMMKIQGSVDLIKAFYLLDSLLGQASMG
ncbi:hypothetical protein LQV63_04940 [Paenibacillus profundus]|uniref:Uncharacterized protein n=1 Tax=Paenibacillus profundus TaxID=1173085 RepID=A0ABS8YBT2_9BACL|nr:MULTISPECIES: hypothetical protein [Paenibacillus]MCE5168659.1 hypothetical protein [Paenibacillus profundus]